jgi:hypothetical protein
MAVHAAKLVPTRHHPMKHILHIHGTEIDAVGRKYLNYYVLEMVEKVQGELGFPDIP